MTSFILCVFLSCPVTGRFKIYPSDRAFVVELEAFWQADCGSGGEIISGQ